MLRLRIIKVKNLTKKYGDFTAVNQISFEVEEGAWSGIGTVIGTLTGFLGGIYIPIGTLSETIGNVIKCTPIIYSTAMFRDIMTEETLDIVFKGLPEEMIMEYSRVMGIHIEIFDKRIGIIEEWILLLLCGTIFLAIGAGILKYSKKRIDNGRKNENYHRNSEAGRRRGNYHSLWFPG